MDGKLPRCPCFFVSVLLSSFTLISDDDTSDGASSCTFLSLCSTFPFPFGPIVRYCFPLLATLLNKFKQSCGKKAETQSSVVLNIAGLLVEIACMRVGVVNVDTDTALLSKCLALGSLIDKCLTGLLRVFVVAVHLARSDSERIESAELKVLCRQPLSDNRIDTVHRAVESATALAAGTTTLLAIADVSHVAAFKSAASFATTWIIVDHVSEDKLDVVRNRAMVEAAIFAISAMALQLIFIAELLLFDSGTVSQPVLASCGLMVKVQSVAVFVDGNKVGSFWGWSW